MKKSFCSFSFIILITCIAIKSPSQEIMYGQFFSVPSYYNPAACGKDEGIRASSLYHTTYPGSDWDYRSMYFGADLGDVGLPATGGIGLFYSTGYYHSGWTSTNTLGLNLSAKIRFSPYMGLRLGVKLAWFNVGVDLEKYREQFYYSQNPIFGGTYQDTIYNPDPVPVNKVDIGAGALFQFSSKSGFLKGDLGFSVNHIFRPDISLWSGDVFRQKVEWMVHGSMIIDISHGKNIIHPLWDHGFKIIPGFYFQRQYQNMLFAGCDLTKLNIFLGTWYLRYFDTGYSTDALIINIGYQFFLPNGISIKPDYSYEIRFQKEYLPVNRGIHEFSFVFIYDKLRLIKKKTDNH